MKLMDIKDANGKSLLPKKQGCEDINDVITLTDSYDKSRNLVIDQIGKLQVAVEVDRGKLENLLIKYFGTLGSHLSARLKPEILNDEIVNTLIAHKEELFKIIYVKD